MNDQSEEMMWFVFGYGYLMSAILPPPKIVPTIWSPPGDQGYGDHMKTGHSENWSHSTV